MIVMAGLNLTMVGQTRLSFEGDVGAVGLEVIAIAW